MTHEYIKLSQRHNRNYHKYRHTIEITERNNPNYHHNRHQITVFMVFEITDLILDLNFALRLMRAAV